MKFEFVETNYYRRWPCHICGGTTEKDEILIEVLEGEWKGLRVCPFCLQSKDIDGRLQKNIDRMRAEAEELRSLLGCIDAPTYEDWLAKTDEVNKEWQKRYEAGEFGEYKKPEDGGFIEDDFIPEINEVAL